MAKDFRASQLETGKIILSGSFSGKPSLEGVIYSTGSRTSPTGTFEEGMLTNVGTDVSLFISGNMFAKGKNVLNTGGSPAAGVTLFGGDVVVSGTLFTEKFVANVTEENITTSNHYVSGSLFVGTETGSPKASFVRSAGAGKKDHPVAIGVKESDDIEIIAFDYNEATKTADAVIYELSGDLILSASDNLKLQIGNGAADGTGPRSYIFASADSIPTVNSGSNNPRFFQRALFFTGSSTVEPAVGQDVNFFVSGAISGSGHHSMTVAAFGGDLVVSGNLTVNPMHANSASLHIDAKSGRVGVGTKHPLSILHIADEGIGSVLVNVEQASADADGPNFTLRKTRGTIESPAAVASGDFIGAISFAGHDGNTISSFASITGKVDGNSISGTSRPGKVLISGAPDGTSVLKDLAIFHRDADGGATISGSIHHTTGGITYLAQGDGGVTITSASSGQIVLSSPLAKSAAQDAFKTIILSGSGGSLLGQTQVVADAATDTLTLGAGAGITLRGDQTADSIIISAANDGSNHFESHTAGFLSTSGSTSFGGSLALNHETSDIGTDTFFFVSGTMDSIGTAVRGTAVFGGDVLISGSLYGVSELQLCGREVPGTDTLLFVSGGIGTRGTAVRGVGTFGGDLVVSGGLVVRGKDGNSAFGGGISGSIHHTSRGISYLKAGANVTITSASSGQITIAASSGGGGGSDGDFNQISNVKMATTSSVSFAGGLGANFEADFALPGTFFFVSGSKSKISAGGLATGANDVDKSVFGGDLLLSGVLRGNFRAANDSTEELVASASTFRSLVHKKVVFSRISDFDPLPLGIDTFFEVSGAIGSRGGPVRGTALFGGDVFVSGGLGINTVNVTTDGKVGIGVAAPSYKLSVGGNAEFGEYLYHRGDTDTNVRFRTNRVTVTAGNNNIIEGSTSTGVRVTILSGSGVTGGDGLDVSVFVSGAIDSKGGARQGATVFGGDVVISGTLHGGSPLSLGGGAIFNNVKSATSDFRVATQFVDYALHVDSDKNSVTFGSEFAPGMDIHHFVSGSTTALKDGSRVGGVASFGGDVVISGSLRTKLVEVTHHQYAESSDSNRNFIPWYGQSEFSSVGTSNTAVMAFPGRLKKAIVRSTNTAGTTIVGVHIGTASMSIPDVVSTEAFTVDMSSANTGFAFNFSGSTHYAAGDLLSISVDPQNTPGNVYVSCIFENDVFDID